MMANQAMQRGPIGDRFAANLRQLRREAGLDQAGLAEKLDALQHPIGVNSISRLEKGERRADVSDLIALAVALNCSPARLFLPEDEGAGDVALTSTMVVTWNQAWRWATGESPLPGPGAADKVHSINWGDLVSASEWRSRNRPNEPSSGMTGAEIRGVSDQLGEVISSIQAAEDRGVPRRLIFAYLDHMQEMWSAWQPLRTVVVEGQGRSDGG